MKIDKVYIITIEHSEEHYNSLIERLDQLKLPDGIPFQIWSGVEGRELFKTEQGRKDYGIKFYDKWNIGGNWWGRDVTTGEAGGICSHVEVWEDAYEKGYQNVLIIEDDFEPVGVIDWNCFDELHNYDYDLIFLSRLLNKRHKNVYDSNVGLDHFVKPGYSYNTHIYIMSYDGIKKLKETNLDILRNNIIVSDEFLPATYAWHPRQDLRALFNQNMNALALNWDPIGQFRSEDNGNSSTSPLKGVDY